MPEMDGLEACRRIEAMPELAGTVVVMLTAQAQATDRQRGLEAGADGYLTKPFSPRELLELVDRLMTGLDRTPT